jgi:hypothetical protein
MSETMHCPDANVLSAFAEGKLSRKEMPPVFAHLETCATCRFALGTANETISVRRPFRFDARWLLAAAVIALAAFLIPQYVRTLSSSPSVERLAELAPKSARAVETRLTGGIGWARYRGPVRTSESTEDPDRLRLGGAVGDLVAEANREPSAKSQHAAGIGLVLIERPMDAIARLRAATRLDPRNARVWSDLAAAQYAAALLLDRPSLYPEALASADQSLRLDANLPEALFNRALVLERLGLAAQAREAWDRYLAVDSSSPWAVEARERLSRLPVTTSEERFHEEQPRLERAAIAGDYAAVRAIVDQHRQQTRTNAEVVTLGKWGEAVLGQDEASAARFLAIARATGDALQRASGETLLRDAVAAIERADTAARARLAEAHVFYVRGRLAYSRRHPGAAEPDLRRAAVLFASANDPMALVARYFAACTRYDQNGVSAARAELASLLHEISSRDGYLALAAQIRWQLALCAMVDDDWHGALPLLSASRDGFVRLGERSNGGFLGVLLAGAHGVTGRPDEAWSARIRSFHALAGEGTGDRMQAALSETASMELRAGRAEVARSILQIEESANRAAGNDVLLAYALVRGAVLSVQLGDTAAADAKAREAAATAQRIPDAALRARAAADADFAIGAATLDHQALTRSVDGYRSIERPLFLPEARLYRAQASLRRGATEEATRDVETGIAELERHRVRFADTVVGRGIFDAGTELFRLAIRLALERHDVDSAFAFAERARAHIAAAGDAPVSAHTLRGRLAGSSTAVLSLTVFPDEVLSFCVTEDEVTVGRRPFDESRLAELVARSAGGDRDSSRELYDVLVRPTEVVSSAARHLIVIADLALEGVPYASLWDAKSQRHLIERATVAVAPSASSLRGGAAARRPDTVLAVALPSGDRGRTASLPQTRAELSAITQLYQGAITLPDATFAAMQQRAGDADLIHIAGHTDRRGVSGESVLLFAGADGNVDRVSWRSVAETSLRARPVVVLAACETLRRPPSPRTFALSLGGGFLAAGATDVIGTLTPLADNDAHELFQAMHRHLRDGLAPADALRRVQLDALSNDATRRRPWHAVALLTNRIPLGENDG